MFSFEVPAAYVQIFSSIGYVEHVQMAKPIEKGLLGDGTEVRKWHGATVKRERVILRPTLVQKNCSPTIQAVENGH